MNGKHYMIFVVKFVSEHKNIKKATIFLDKFAPAVVTWCFYAILACLALNIDIRAVYFLAIPWFSFFCVSAVRNKLNFKRPFEELGFEPLLPHSPGRAFPSRHAASSAVITMAVFYIFPAAGIFLAFVSVVVCLTRVLTGVHYVRDVVVGAAVGALMGYFGFFIIL